MMAEKRQHPLLAGDKKLVVTETRILDLVCSIVALGRRRGLP